MRRIHRYSDNPLLNEQFAIENGHRNSGFTMDLPITICDFPYVIVDLPIKIGDFPYVGLPEAIPREILW